MDKSITKLIRALLVLVMAFAIMPVVTGTIQKVEADSTASAQSLTYGYAYDCQREPAFPAKGNSFKGSGFMTPLVGRNQHGTQYEGNWRLYNRGTYKDYKNKSNYLDVLIGFVQKAYGMDSPDEIPIHELKDGSKHIAYGVLIALTENNKEAFYIGDTWFGGGGYVLSGEPLVTDPNPEFVADKTLPEIMENPVDTVEPEPAPEPEAASEPESNSSSAVTQYTITYELDGGELDGAKGPVAKTYDAGAVITLPTPTRDGYTFDYWEGSKYNAGDKYTVNENHTFKAVWKEADSGKADKKDSSDKDGSTGGGSSKKGVKTGDENHLAFWILLMTASLAGTAGITLRKKRRG